MTGDTVCQNCKSAKRKEKVWWICRKNCVERNNIDVCMMKPAQYELTPQDKDALSDYPDWVPPKVPPPGCPCNRYTSCKECVEATTTPCPFKPCDTCESICEMRLQEHDEKIWQDATEKANKIFDHTLALCEAIIEKLDCQSKLGFNVMLIKRDIESLRACSAVCRGGVR